jgi:hypothetical protein
MAPRIGYLLPTRENTMAGQPEAVPLLKLAGAGLGFDSIWVGTAVGAPRHDPLTLLAAVAARVPRISAPPCCCRPCATGRWRSRSPRSTSPRRGG